MRVLSYVFDWRSKLSVMKMLNMKENKTIIFMVTEAKNTLFKTKTFLPVSSNHERGVLDPIITSMAY